MQLLHAAMAGAGTNERVLDDVLLGRSNADMRAINEAYHQKYRRSLTDAVKSELTTDTERHFVVVLQAARAEDSAPVHQPDIDRDILEIYNATEARIGADALQVCGILSTRNDNQIRAIAYGYNQRYGRNLEDVIKKVTNETNPPLFRTTAG